MYITASTFLMQGLQNGQPTGKCLNLGDVIYVYLLMKVHEVWLNHLHALTCFSTSKLFFKVVFSAIVLFTSVVLLFGNSLLCGSLAREKVGDHREESATFFRFLYLLLLFLPILRIINSYSCCWFRDWHQTRRALTLSNFLESYLGLVSAAVSGRPC